MKTLSLIFGLALSVSSIASTSVSHLNYFTGQSKMFFNAGFDYADNSIGGTTDGFVGKVEARYGVLSNSQFGVTANFNSFDTGATDRVNEFGDINLNWATRFVNAANTKWDWLLTYSPRLGDANGFMRGNHRIGTGFAYTNAVNEMMELNITSNFNFFTKDTALTNDEVSHNWANAINTRFHFVNNLFAGLGVEGMLPTSDKGAGPDVNFTGRALIGYAMSNTSNITATVNYVNPMGDNNSDNNMAYGLSYNVEL